MPTIQNNKLPEFGAKQSRDYISYQEFIRCSYVNVYSKMAERAYQSHFATRNARHGNKPESREIAARLLDSNPIFQLKSWCIRNLRRLKYSQPDLGIYTMINGQSDELVPKLESLIADAGDDLLLNPDLEIPDYYRWVDFHQQPNGVWRGDLAGLIYDYGRRTTNPAAKDPNQVYRMMWKHLPKNRDYKRVLDWGTGHGGGIITWVRENLGSEGYGVDVAAPCLKLAHVRAREAGVRVKFSQQDIANMSYETDHFDMVFHMFMFHELPQQVTPQLLEEVRRVLKPGGVFIGMELSLIPEQPSQHVVQFSEGWLNNEPYMPACVEANYADMGLKAGFSRSVSIPAGRNQEKNLAPVSKEAPPMSLWNYYIMEK